MKKSIQTTGVKSEPMTQQMDQIQPVFTSLLSPPQPTFEPMPAPRGSVYLIRLDEINEEKPVAFRQALANVFAAVTPEQRVRLFYLLEGTPRGVSLYFGIVTTDSEVDGHEALKNLRSAIDGQLPGINFGEEISPLLREEIFSRWRGFPHRGVMLGVPTESGEPGEDRDNDSQGIERLVRAVQSGSEAGYQQPRWQLAVVAEPLASATVRSMINEAYQLSSELAAAVRTNIQISANNSEQRGFSRGESDSKSVSTSVTNGRNKGESATEGRSWGESSSRGSSSSSSSKNSGGSESKTFSSGSSYSKTDGTSSSKSNTETFSLNRSDGGSIGVSRELSDKRAQHFMDTVDKQLIERLRIGLTKGLFSYVVYFGAANRSVFNRLKTAAKATFQGSQPSPHPLFDIEPDKQAVAFPYQLPSAKLPKNVQYLFHSLYLSDDGRLGSLVTTKELAIIASLPQYEMQGVRRKKTVGFVVDLPDLDASDAIRLGSVIDRGRACSANPVSISREDLNKHIFITGVTGAGKTTTCLKLITESGLPFLVIEPAKTEYRALAGRYGTAIDYYRPADDPLHSFRLNPFAFVHRGQRISSVAGFVKNAIAAVMPLEASMPMMIEDAIREAYRDRGWDVETNEFLLSDDPFDPSADAWPTFTDVILQIDRLIPQYKLGREFEEKYRGSLVSRLRSLTDGALGPILNVQQSLDVQALLKRNAVIELEEIKGADEKSLLMALLLGALNEAVRVLHAQDSSFRQLTLVEEAHRLLALPQPGDTARVLAVEAFADMLAEVRKYGLGLIIADQIPAKLIPDVIKNTHIKIVHRLFAEDDRRAMGETMMLTEQQRAFLPNLTTGEAIVFCGGWHGAAHARIDPLDVEKPPIDLSHYFEQQLFRERERYYPTLSQLGIFGSDTPEQQSFAKFILEGRRALGHLLAAASPKSANRGRSTEVMAAAALRKLKTWCDNWRDEIARRCGSSPRNERPHFIIPCANPLAAALLALIVDANPRPHLEITDPVRLRPRDENEWGFQAKCVDTLLEHVANAADVQSFRAAIQANRDTQAFSEWLGKIRSF